ncbi:MAG TPA: urease accessory protein UreD [Aliiroseovarius sp.]|nr:urease accessory protein UreD [Aliiroseovarius sp.]
MSSVTLQSEPVRQRARGAIRLGYGAAGLERLHQSGCGRCLFPNPFGGDAQAVVINTAGGLTGGDRFGVEVTLGQEARLVLTTQAAERIYRSIGGAAEVHNQVQVGAGASLHWLPQETILFDHAALRRRLEVELAADASFLGLETLVLGRRAMGEAVTRAALRDQWRIRRNGRLIHGEALRLDGDIGKLSGTQALLDGARAGAVLVLVSPHAETLLETARALLPADGVRAAASAWNGRLVVRWMAQDLMPLKAAQARFLAGFPGAAVPRVWQI